MDLKECALGVGVREHDNYFQIFFLKTHLNWKKNKKLNFIVMNQKQTEFRTASQNSTKQNILNILTKYVHGH